MSADAWLSVGLIGQMIFSARFVVQWIHSERLGRSSVPMPFWYLSIVGAVILLGYAVYMRDAVFIIGQAGGLLIYSRNLQLRWREAA
jgi:lipid-A-disaccharide synthase-like uncharacterized protein